jgi:multiple antibiotic resistance protein
MELVRTILVDALYLLVLINPISKISVLAVLSSPDEQKDLPLVVRKSSMVALLILLAIILFGDFVLRQVFHVSLQSLQISGGLVLLWHGFNALRKGVFFEQSTHERFTDLAIVPLACPMIAGPATIAASLAHAAHFGILGPALSVTLAVFLNAIIMRFSTAIAKMLGRFNILGALIRISGIIVMTIGVEMILNGLTHWITELP